MLTFDEVLHVGLTGLESAVTDWSATLNKLKELEETAENGLRSKADKADWAGENAGITKSFVKKTAKEFSDAAKVAESIRNVLRDALSEFKSAQRSLEDVIKTAPGKGIHIDAEGIVSYLVHPDRRSKNYDGPKPTEADFEAVRATIKAAVEKANEADEIASRALRTLVGKDKNNFSGTEYSGLKQAAKAQDAEDAKKAASIVKKGDDATPEEIDRLNKYLKDNKDDRYFAEQFALRVGVKGGIEYWADLGDPSDGSRLGLDHSKKIKELQENWSMTLAAASHSNSEDMSRWKSDMIKSGDEVFRTRGTSVYGFQVMSNLMRDGTYETKFLNDYGKSLFAAEQKMTRGNASNADLAWNPSFSTSHLNWDGKDLGRDPMTGFMEALGHNPKASTEFFNSKLDLTPDNHNDNKNVSAFKYFTEERDWPEDNTKDGFSDKYGYDSLGHALESATTGNAYDAPADEFKDARTEDNAKVMQKVVNFYGSEPKYMHEQDIADSLSRMGSAYIDEFNRSLEQEDVSSEYAQPNSPFGAFKDGHSRFGEEYDDKLLFTRGDAVDFMGIVAQSKEGHAQMSAAQSIYTTSVMDAHGPNPGSQQLKDTDLTDLKTALRIGSETHGILDYSRMGQIDKDFEKDTEEHAKAIAETTEWVKFGTGAVIAGGVVAVTGGFGAAAVLAPLAVETVGGGLSTYLGMETDDLAEQYEKDGRELIKEKSDKLSDEALLMGEANAQKPKEAYVQAPGWSQENRNFLEEELTKYIKDSRSHARDDILPDPYEKED
ncbi:hypothetical protein ACFZCL_23400 [Streptomyces sp. NPDC008159]|uniref:hypothetical protein n=1 Tax=Streptomyces sp. NPDC008159 TaxID=3364817 RepID=UPI0036E9AFEC